MQLITYISRQITFPNRLNRGCRFVWAALFIFCCSYLPLIAQSPHTVKEFSLSGPAVLKAYTFSGNIDIQGVSETQKVRVELYVDRGYAFWSESSNLENYHINILQRGNEIFASVEERKRGKGLFGSKTQFNFKIYVPENTSAEVKSSGGDISMGGITGNQMARVGGGNIVMNNLTGKIGAYTSGGHITIKNSSGTLFAQTEGGDITAERAEGEIRFRANAGNITCQRISGSFIARADAGNIRSQFLEVGRGISMESHLGNIFAEIPERSEVDLSVSGSSVVFEDTEHFIGQRGAREINGRLNGGGVPVQLQTSLGTVILTTYR